MNRNNLLSRIDKAYALEERLASAKYKCRRDDKGNMAIYFVNGNVIQFPYIKLRPYQLDAQHELFVLGKKRLFLVRPRRAGKEVESWTLLLEAAIEKPGLYLMIYPTNVRARIVLWDGSISLPDGRSLKFLDMIPRELVVSFNKQEMSITLTNGAIIRVIGSDIDPDKLRGVNVLAAVFSEYAFSDPRVLYILMPVFRQNGGWFILQTTFNGMNHAYRFMKEIQTNPDWYCRVDSVESLVDEHGNRYVTDDMIEEDRKSGMPEFMIQQEYYSIVQLNEETLYFAIQMNAMYESSRIDKDIVLPGKRVRAHLDIGWDDSTALVLEQQDRNGNPVIIGYHENRNKVFEYFIHWAELYCQQKGVFLDKNVYLPHDGANKNPGNGKGYSDYVQEMGYIPLIMPRPSSHIMAVQAIRKMLYRVKIDSNGCQRLIDCLSNYSKEFDQKSGTYNDTPKHDWSSHGVKAFQTMTFAYDSNKVNENTYDVIYYNRK